MSRENKMLIVGIDKVKDAPQEKLNNARKGAEQVMAMLQARYGFTHINGSPLLDEQATRQHISESLNELV